MGDFVEEFPEDALRQMPLIPLDDSPNALGELPDLPRRNSALFSPGRRHRYRITRIVRAAGVRWLCWVMLNPSHADAHWNDHTMRRVMWFTQAFGFDACVGVNLFAYRAVSPRMLLDVDDPVGQKNDEVLRVTFALGLPTVVAWGSVPPAVMACGKGEARDRVHYVLRDLGLGERMLWCLGKTAAGDPRHPSRLGNNVERELWQLPEGATA